MFDIHQTKSHKIIKYPGRIAGYLPHNQVHLIKGGSEFFSLMRKLIDEAKISIHLQSYIFDADDTGRSIIRALLRAARRNVKVSILVDGYASQEFPIWAIESFRKEAISFRWFHPVFRSRNFYLGRRLHHKVFVVDSEKALIGGVNISDRYNDTIDHKAWLDWALYVTGDVVPDIFRICNVRAPIETQRLRNAWRSHTQTNMVRFRINDWVNRKMQIWNSYMEMFRKAESHIRIVSPYFIPGKTFLKKLLQAASRGVKIDVVLGKNSDVTLARYAEKYLYPRLLEKHVRIFEYQPNILHGKLATYDSKWVTIGSYNVNNLSSFASVELNLDVKDKKFARVVEDEVQRIITNDCREITREEFERKSTLFHRFLYRTAYDILRILYFLFTFNMRQKD
jgi:cardiolipin synthase A/B